MYIVAGFEAALRRGPAIELELPAELRHSEASGRCAYLPGTPPVGECLATRDVL
jgi:hypothetical protein